MAQVLLIHDSPQIGQMYSMNLGLSLGLSVIFKNNIEESLEILSLHPKFSIIICKSHLNSKEVANHLIKFLGDKKIDIPLSIITNDEYKLPENIIKFPIGKDYPALIDHVSHVLSIDIESVTSDSLTEFMNVGTDLFYSLKHAPCDVYQRSKRKPGKYHFVRKLSQGAEVTQNEVMRYQYEGIKQLYIKTIDYKVFIEAFSAAAHNLLDDESLSLDKRVEVGSTSMRTVKEQIQHLGLSQTAIKTAQKTMKSIISMVDKTSAFKKLLDLLLKGRPGYHYNHCQISTYLCSHIILNMDQEMKTTTKKGMQTNIETLGFVSFFHDITLLDPKLAKIRNEKELESANLTKKEQSQVLNHANETVDLLEKFPNAPIGASSIIRQHHGSRSGVGFPTFFSQDISPLAIIFIVAQDLADRIIENNGEDFNLAYMILEMREKFKPSQYHRVIDTLEALKL